MAQQNRPALKVQTPDGQLGIIQSNAKAVSNEDATQWSVLIVQDHETLQPVLDEHGQRQVKKYDPAMLTSLGYVNDTEYDNDGYAR